MEKFIPSKMEIPRVTACCFCIDLKIAGIMIGSFWIFIALLSFLTGYQGFVGCAILITVAGIWIYAVFKKQPMLMVPFIIIDGILRIIFVVLTFYDLYRRFDEPNMLYWFFFDLCAAALSIYMFIVHYSLYRTLVEESNSAQNQQVAYEPPTTQMQRAISEV